MILKAVWEEVVWKVGSGKEVQGASAAFVGFVSRSPRGPLGSCKPDFHIYEPQHGMPCVSEWPSKEYLALSLLVLKRLAKRLVEVFSFGLFLLLLKGIVVV